MLATVRLYYILQLAMFDSCIFIRTSVRPIDAGIQDMVTSVLALTLELVRQLHYKYLSTTKTFSDSTNSHEGSALYYGRGIDRCNRRLHSTYDW
jgi:hypothetical protein